MAGPATYYSDAHASELDAGTRELIERRERVLGSAYRLFYDHPVRFVRAQGTKLWDADGREYLDAYNNVPSVGHAHPRVVAAMAEQAATLNTHTRYLDEAIVSYAEDILSTMPDSIGNIMFTCTGSEANDLALRIAKHATGGTGVIVTQNAYHGVTTEIAAISPSLGGVGSIADWVELVPVGGNFGASVRAAIARLEARGIRLAALIVDTIFASDGVFPDVVGLADAAAAARAAGGLFIADEVQPGFGRLGHGMWGFERHAWGPSIPTGTETVPGPTPPDTDGAERRRSVSVGKPVEGPDLVTVGKPMGNGQPIAAVMARPELIDAFGREVRYFNTFGGSNVSIAAAQATLDVVRDEGLIENARDVGGYLGSALRGLGLEVRQAGLFLGVQLASMDETLRIVNALRDRGVLVAASGPANDSLKIRPPLVFSRDDADRLVTELAAVLRA